MTKRLNQRRVEQIRVLLTGQEKAVIEQAALMTGVAMADFMRDLSLPAARAIVAGKSEEQIRLAINSTGILLAGKVTNMTPDDTTE